jgi:anion-transporting  ArsA/GET3 family ATPase
LNVTVTPADGLDRLDELVRTKKVIVCVGSGGVGKTTMSAAIAARAAERGKSACVLTIDPAKRLANAMGLTALGNTESRVAEDRLEGAGMHVTTGQLWAMMLDTKRTWDDLVARFALDEAQARRILANRYYQQISSALAGSQEFMAMEKLYELHESGKYDLLVLDTPPTRHALDFLDAPKKMMGFMDEGVLKLFATPTRLGFGILRNSSAWLFKMLERVTGFEVLRDISDFVGSFSGMHAGFGERAKRVEDLLRGGGSAFVLVTSPNPLTIEEAIFFFAKLAEYRMPFGGFVVNRVHADALVDNEAKEVWRRMREDPAEILGRLGATGATASTTSTVSTLSQGLAERMAENFDRFQTLAETDAAEVGRLRRACPGTHFWRTVPAFDLDIHDLSGLARVNRYLFAT